jgi:hypothetical protein
MRKISTLFKKDHNNLGRVIDEINPENQWVFEGKGTPTRKYDGSAAAIINGELYKRYDVKKGKPVPYGAIPCQEPDEITGHHPHWVKCEPTNPADKYFFEAFDNEIFGPWQDIDGTYELCGEKVQGNPEKIKGHILIKHGFEVLELSGLTFKEIKEYLSDPKNDIEGIVFHHVNDGRMCKIRKSDFGIKR